MTTRSSLLALIVVSLFSPLSRAAELVEARPVEISATVVTPRIAPLPGNLAAPLDEGKVVLDPALSAEARTEGVLALPAPAQLQLPALKASATPASAQTASAQPASAQATVGAAPASAQPAARAVIPDEAVRGKTLLLVGTRGSRPFIIEEAVRVARELGLNLVLLDKAESRNNSKDLVPDENFVSAAIDKRDDKTVKQIVEQVQALKASRPIDYVMSFRSHHAKLVGKIVDGTGIQGVSSKVALTAEDKVRTRKALNVDPAQRVAYKEVKSEDEIREFWREYHVNGAKYVMKSKLGENSRFVELDIDSLDNMLEAYRKMDAALRAEAKKKESSDTIFNRFPGIMVERMLEKAPGTVEASVEMVVQDGKVKFAMVSDTHGIGKNGELAGGAMTFPSQMTPQVQEALIAASARALEIIGLKNGNARTDIMMTPEGPKIIEINPFLGGAAIFTAVKLVSGVSLVEWGIRAMLNLALPEMPAFTTVVDYRFAASQNAGRIVSITGVDAAKAVPGVAHVQLLAEEGDAVSAPIENGFEEWAEIMGTGETYEKARNASLEGLSKIKANILVEQTADYLQPRWMPGVVRATIVPGQYEWQKWVQLEFKSPFYYTLFHILAPFLLNDYKINGMSVASVISSPEGPVHPGLWETNNELAKLRALPGVLNARKAEKGNIFEVIFADEASYNQARSKKRLPRLTTGFWVRPFVAAPEGRQFREQPMAPQERLYRLAQMDKLRQLPGVVEIHEDRRNGLIEVVFADDDSYQNAYYHGDLPYANLYEYALRYTVLTPQGPVEGSPDPRRSITRHHAG